MTTTEIIERHALRELLQLIRELNDKEETNEHHHTDNRSYTGQPEAAR